MVLNMDEIKSDKKVLKYPRIENAVAFVGQNGAPFRRALVGITYPFPDYSVVRGTGHRVNVFELVLEGEGEVMLSGVWKRVKAGDIYVLLEGEEHRYRSDPTSPMKKIWVNYEAEYISSMLSAYGIGSGIYRSEGARRYFERVYEATQRGSADAYIYYAIAECIHGIIHSVAAEMRQTEGADAYRIREALNGAVYEKITLDDLAATLHISKSNIIRVFKKQYGVTPYEYLIGLKIDTSKLLLKNTHMTIGEIAERVQISDQHYFSTLFLERVGLRPKDYRKAKQGK